MKSPADWKGSRMNPTGASLTQGNRILPPCVLLLICVTVPMELTAQTRADRESVRRVVELLSSTAGQFGDEIAPLSGVWSVAISKFAKGDSREIEIPVTVGERYEVTGVSEAVGTDVDICVYGPGGVRIDCDTLDDNVPIVSFTAETDGVYRAVMTAASVEGWGMSYAGMIVLRAQKFRDCIEEYGLDAWSPWVLHGAARLTTNPTIVRLLLQAGADPNAPDDNGLTPLHEGARNSNPTVVSHLLDASAKLNVRDNEGYTALHWTAAQSGNGRVVKVLLDRGADPFAESNDGRTPLHSALRYRADPRTPAMDSNDVDAYLRVLRLDGTPVASDDDGGLGSNACVEFRAVFAGDYLMVATSYEEGEVTT